MWGVHLASDSFVYSLFGVQIHGEHPDAQQSSLIDQFDNLIQDSPSSLERLMQDGGADPSPGKTHVWLAYWETRQAYQAWWTSPDVSHFWASLPPNAGMWREIISPQSKHAQQGTNYTPGPIGLGHLGSRISISDKFGYWGCYHRRTPVSSSAEGGWMNIKTSLERPLSRSIAASGSGIINPSQSPRDSTIRPGRVHMSHFPDNLCFVVEGQDHAQLTPEERAYWFEHLDPAVTQWITDLTAADEHSGILDARLCYDSTSGTFRDTIPAALNYNRKIQFFYFADLRHMLRTGKQNDSHVQLRGNFLGAYGPGGPLYGTGQICMWVETSVLKPGELECEYVGCREGTGMMAFETLDEFTR